MSYAFSGSDPEQRRDELRLTVRATPDGGAALWAGLRLMECLRLRVKDIDFG